MNFRKIPTQRDQAKSKLILKRIIYQTNSLVSKKLFPEVSNK